MLTQRVDPASTRPASRIQKYLKRYRDVGARGMLRKLMRDHVYASSESMMMELRLDRCRPGVGDQPDWLTIVTVQHPRDLPRMNGFLRKRRPDFARMLADGKIATFALAGNVAIGCAWSSLTDHHDPVSREHYRVRDREAYGYCFLVDPAFRRRNVALPLYRAMIRHLIAIGIRRAYVVIDRVNRVSYLIQRRFGGREIGVRVRHYRLFRYRWTRMSRYTGTLGLASDAS